MKIELDLELPDELIDPSLRQQIVQQAREQIVLRLFAERRIPSGLATRLLGLTRLEFLDLAQRRGIPTVDYTDEDWRQDLEALEEYDRRRLSSTREG